MCDEMTKLKIVQEVHEYVKLQVSFDPKLIVDNCRRRHPSIQFLHRDVYYTIFEEFSKGRFPGSYKCVPKPVTLENGIKDFTVEYRPNRRNFNIPKPMDKATNSD